MSIPRYKFAIMLNGMFMSPWQIKVYEEIIKTGLTDCELLIVKKPTLTVGREEQHSTKSFLKKVTAPSMLFEQFKKRKLNAGLYKLAKFEPINHIDQIQVQPEKSGKVGEEFNELDVQQIKSKNLDFIIRFGFGILKGDILNAAKWGVWSFHHGDEQLFRGGPPGFWEIFKKNKQQGVILQRLTEKLDAGKIILKRQYSVLSHSYTESVTKLIVESADMPAQALRMINNTLISVDELGEVKTTAPIYRYPNNFQFLRFQYILLINRIKFKWAKLFKKENWVIGYRNDIDENYKYIAAPVDGEYFADPFVFTDNNKPYIVAEHYSYLTKKGSIVLIEPGMNQVKTIIKKNTHLSYPYIFEENGIIYMLPEESNSGKLSLYKWNSETKGFDFIQSIIDIPAIDASLLKHEGKYYLFTGIKGELPNEKLFLYYSDLLEGPYIPHASNPVKVSPEGARMAGGFIVKNDELLRPSQFSVKYYGEKIVFQKIVNLSPTEYEEEFHSELKPMPHAPFNCGLHTYNKNSNFEVIDLKKMRSTFASFRAHL